MVLNFDERFREMPKLAQVVLASVQPESNSTANECRTVLQICYSSYTLLNFRSRTNSIPTSPISFADSQSPCTNRGVRSWVLLLRSNRFGNPGVDPGGAAGAGSPQQWKLAPLPLWRRGASFHIHSTRSIFAPSALYGRLPASQGVLLIAIGTLFAHDGAF